jgi:hypothetical protein
LAISNVVGIYKRKAVHIYGTRVQELTSQIKYIHNSDEGVSFIKYIFIFINLVLILIQEMKVSFLNKIVRRYCSFPGEGEDIPHTFTYNSNPAPEGEQRSNQNTFNCMRE